MPLDRQLTVPLLAEAMAALLLSSLAVRLHPVGRLVHGPASQHASPAPPATIAGLRRAIEAVARRLPWKALCFEQGLAAHWLLRRRGFASTLTYGAATIDGVLRAHVWVRSADRDVIGCDSAERFAPLAKIG